MGLIPAGGRRVYSGILEEGEDRIELYDLIDTRMRYGRPLICTTNIGSLSEGEQQFGSRIHSRLLAKDVLRVSLRVDDYRRKLEPVREEKAF